MTLLRLAIRSHRTGAIAMAAIGAFSGILNAVAYVQVAGSSPAERHVFAQQMEVFGKQLSYLLPAPVQLDTMGGYLTWRDFGTIALVYTIWAMLAGTGAARGDEERGLTESWLAAGVSRIRWLLTRAVGFTSAALLSIAVTMAATELGTLIAKEPLDLVAMAAEGVVFLALTLVGFAIGLAIAQLVITRRAASSIGGAVILALYVLNSSSRTGADVGAIRYASPFYLFDQSAPLLQGGALDAGTVLALLATAATLTLLAVAAFVRRDVGGSLVRLGTERIISTFRPSADPLLRIPVLALVDQQRWWIVGWSAALCVLAYFMTSLARSIIDSLNKIPTMRVYSEKAGIAAYSDFVGVIWFSTALLLVSVLVIVQVNGWAADDGEGRLETILAAGASRTRVVLERIAALLILVAIVSAASTIVVAIAASAFDITVSGDRLALATVLILPLAFALASLGHLLVGWRPRVAVLLLGAVTVISYFTQQFAPIFDWPDWVRNTSLFALYGTPMTKDDWSGGLTLVAIGVIGTAAALAAMRRRDVGV
ncbi:MAG: ABC transporter permease subunit [Candidatus Limnocylindria bacterium]|nr:ABC transporter permease subunit [Candidatus Limnocylindria bacterium]